MIDDESLQMYVEESREHLEDIENDLLAIEEAGENIDEELVNKVFRAAHSMKGGAGFLGLTQIKELAHKIENVLDMIRNRQLVPTPEIVNIILLSFDRLREMIENISESNEMDISEHVDALVSITSGNLPAGEEKSVENEIEITDSSGRPIFTVKEFDLLQARKGGKFVYLIEFDLIHDIHRKDKNPLDVINDMQATGQIIDVKLDLDAVGTLEDDIISNKIPMYVLYSTIIEPDIITTLFDLPENQIKHLGEDDARKEVEQPSTQPEPEVSEPGPVVESQAMQPQQPGDQITQTEKISESPQQAVQPVVQPESEKPEPVAKKPAPPKKPKPVKTMQPETLRVHVSLLENLMNLAGELVLSRNQLLQAISVGDEHEIAVAGQRIDLVTSELQEAIMLTRMQPVGNIFNKFPRVVRDLARDLGKQIELQLEGKEVELDKTIIEGLSDPLTHLVRNSADHGIEPPEERIAKGKPPQGAIILKAYHAAGQVNIEIIDDGRGMDADKIARKALEKGLVTEEQISNMTEKDKLNLIFLPGLSTAEKVSDVSGRGVGMDVVKSNLDKLGGQVEIETELNKGTSIRIKLPLRLAIIPSLLVSMGEDRFAIPQVNVDEMIQVPASQVSERIERVGDAEVLILRGELIPLMSLAKVLGINSQKPSIADSKSASKWLDGHEIQDFNIVESSKDVNIVVVQAGSFKYGLVVDELHDSVEIVVKPLGRHLKNCEGYAGATIMGDGRVALILDVAGLAKLGQLSSISGAEKAKEMALEEEKRAKEELHSLFLFNNGPEEHCAVHLDLVARIDMVRADDIEVVGGKKVIQYRGRSLPVFALEEVANVNHLEVEGELVVIVFNIADHEVGLLALPPVDAVEVKLNIDPYTLRQTGIAGSAIVNGNTTLIVDIYELVETLCPEWFEKDTVLTSTVARRAYKVLLVEDSEFFRTQVGKFIRDEGYDVTTAEDGLVAWEMLDEDPHRFDIVVTDLEMPNMDGFELTKKIKSDSRFDHLPVIALTSLAGDEDIARGKEAGVDDYQIKLDKERLLKSMADFLAKKAA